MPDETGSEQRAVPPRSAETPVSGVPGSPPVTPGPQTGVQRAAAFVAAVGAALDLPKHIAERIAFETVQLKIRALCPPELLDDVDTAIALRALMLMDASGQAGKPTLPQITEASESVYSDLAYGWVPKP